MKIPYRFDRHVPAKAGIGSNSGVTRVAVRRGRQTARLIISAIIVIPAQAGIQTIVNE